MSQHDQAIYAQPVMLHDTNKHTLQTVVSSTPIVPVELTQELAVLMTPRNFFFP